MSFGEKILRYRQEMLQDLDKLMQIRSVSVSDPAAAEEALDYMLQRGEEMGFKVNKTGHIAGHVEYGEGEEIAAVLAHVDVVPAGEGWQVEDPYKLTIKDGRMYGRGVVDDKGPAMAALYCLKALKDEGVIPQRKLRLILGAAEEIGMGDMELYFQHEKLPDMAFTPDSEYGICCYEKGILQIEVYAQAHDGTTLTEFHAGSAVNAVPQKAYALIDCTEAEDHQLRRFADARPGSYDFIYTMDGLRIAAAGKAAHACVPQEGLNAATHLIRILAADFGHTVLGGLCAFLDDAIGLETDGTSLGISCCDKESGALTVNVGVVDIDAVTSRAKIDIRYPVTADSEEIFERIRERASYDGLMARVIHHDPPLMIDESAAILSCLKQAYKAVTEEEPQLYATGGGTYARTLKNRGVAFGPVFAGDPSNIHDANEGISEEHYFTHAQICLEAMYRMSQKTAE